MIRFFFEKIFLPAGSLAAIIFGYHYLWFIPPNMPHEDLVTRAMLGMFFTFLGGAGLLIVVFRFGK